MNRLTRGGTAEPVSRDQILRHARGQGNIIFPAQLTTSRIGNLTRLIHTLLSIYVMTIQSYAQSVADPVRTWSAGQKEIRETSTKLQRERNNKSKNKKNKCKKVQVGCRDAQGVSHKTKTDC